MVKPIMKRKMIPQIAKAQPIGQAQTSHFAVLCLMVTFYHFCAVMFKPMVTTVVTTLAIWYFQMFSLTTFMSIVVGLRSSTTHQMLRAKATKNVAEAAA